MRIPALYSAVRIITDLVRLWSNALVTLVSSVSSFGDCRLCFRALVGNENLQFYGDAHTYNVVRFLGFLKRVAGERLVLCMLMWCRDVVISPEEASVQTLYVAL